MSTDLAAYTADPPSLDTLDQQSVVALLERGKTWLTMAVERSAEIGDYVEFKGQAETVRVYTVQKQLGKDAELAAAELVRRAERGIGVAIRKGQEAGEIAKVGDIGGAPPPGGPYALRPGDGVRGHDLQRPTDFVPRDELGKGIYPVTDGVTDEQFDTAIDEAKVEGNLSRANVVRKVTKRPPVKSRRPEVLRGTHHINSRRVMNSTVEAAGNVVIPSLLAEIDLSELEAHDLEEWISSLSESIRGLRSLKTTLEGELNRRV